MDCVFRTRREEIGQKRRSAGERELPGSWVLRGRSPEFVNLSSSKVKRKFISVWKAEMHDEESGIG